MSPCLTMAVRRVNGSGDDTHAAPDPAIPEWARPYDENATDSDDPVTGSDQGVKVRRVRTAKVRSVRGANPR